MPAYRFCRSDDVGLLVAAYNACWRPHFPDAPPMTVEAFRDLGRGIDLWTSSCMLTSEDQRSIGVLLAAKREHETLLHAIAVHPDHQRRGHGRHMLDSLRQKLAILGPPRIVAEVPAAWEAACAFLESCGFARERSYLDFLLQKPTAPPASADFVVAVPVDELVALECAADGDRPRAWERQAETLRRRRQELQGWAVVSDERIEAWLLCREPPPPAAREVVALGCTVQDRREPLFGLLLEAYGCRDDAPVVLRRVSADEVSFDQLQALGFRPAGRTLGYAALP